MTKSAIDIAKARWAEAEAVADAYREQTAKRRLAYIASPTPQTTADICDALAQLAAAKRHANQANILHRTLSTREIAKPC